MKKIIVSSLLAFTCLLSSAFAFSWAGLVDNNTKISENHDFTKPVLNQSNGIYLSGYSNIGDAGNMRIAAEAMYKYSFNYDVKDDKAKLKNVADLDLFKFAGDWGVGPGIVSLSAGRFKYTDFSDAVFKQVSDGLYLSFNSSTMKAAVYAGYTGLLNRLNVSMVDSESKDDDNFYALCPKYLPILADYSYKGLLGPNTIGLQGAFYAPLSDDYTMKAYGTFILNGYIGTMGSYDARVTAGTEKPKGKDSFDGVMLDAKLDTSFYLNNVSMVNIGAEYVSGEQGDIKPFVTVSSRSFGGAPFYNGVIVPKAGIMYAAGKLYANVTERVIISMPKDEAKLDGFDTSASVVYNIFSDLQLGCNLGAYICKETKELSNYYATLKASLAF